MILSSIELTEASSRLRIYFVKSKRSTFLVVRNDGPPTAYPRSGLRYHSEGMRRNEVSTIPLVWCSRVFIYPRMGVALIVGFRSIDWVLTQPPAGGSSIRGALLRGESLIRSAHLAHPLAMLTEPPVGGTNITRNLLFDVSLFPL